jgi:hypothetical protein
MMDAEAMIPAKKSTPPATMYRRQRGRTRSVRILATLSRPDGGRARVAGFDVVRDRRQVRRYPPYPPPAVSASSGTKRAALTVPTPEARS